jgi:hypothetical protein
MSIENEMSDGAAGFFIGFIIASLLWLFILGVTDDWQRKGNFYVANETQGWVVRMNNYNGNATNISKPLPNVEDAAKLANNLNRDLGDSKNTE